MLKKLSAALTTVRRKLSTSTTAEVVGMAGVTIGAGMIYVPAGFIVGGALLVLGGYAAGGDS